MQLPTPTQLNNSEENVLLETVRKLMKRVSQLEHRAGAKTNFANAAGAHVVVGEGNPFDINDPFTGTAILFPAYEDATGTYHIFGMNAGVVQWGANSDDGKIYFGGGDGWLDEFGLFFQNQEGNVTFLDTSAADDTILIYSDAADYLVLKNAVGDKGVRFDIDDAAHSVTQFEFKSDGYIYVDSIAMQSGWIPVSETWTRTGNHTFTVPGDLTAKYRKGAKVHYDDGGAGSEFGVVGSSAHVAGTTTVNLIPNTDYTMAAATIITTLISYIDNPESFPHWFNFAAAPTGFSAAPATPDYKWTTKGNTIFISYIELNNGTSNATTFTAAAPIAPIESIANVAGTLVNNSVVLTTAGRLVMVAGDATITFRTDMASGAWTAANGKRAVAYFFYEF